MAGKKIFVSFLVLLFAVVVVVVQAVGIGEDGAMDGLDASIVGYSAADLESEERMLSLFQSWQQKQGKEYLSGPSEGTSHERFQIFKDNLRYVHAHNVQQPAPTYLLGLTHLADLTHEEFKARYFGTKPRPDRARRTATFMHADVEVPASVDWRAKGAVTAIKDQGQCGSCWSFSTTGAVEGVNFIETGQLMSVSEQQLVDCDTEYDSGCDGGLMDYAFTYIINNGGIDNEADYPYTATQGTCQTTKNVVSINNYEDVPQNNELALQQAVSQQPVSIAIEASGRDFQFYVKGVFTGKCGTELDHGVLLVGYGTTVGLKYWIVKNSWGTSWGQAGYILMQRLGSKNVYGICGINMEASYPIKTGPNPSLDARLDGDHDALSWASS